MSDVQEYALISTTGTRFADIPSGTYRRDIHRHHWEYNRWDVVDAAYFDNSLPFPGGWRIPYSWLIRDDYEAAPDFLIRAAQQHVPVTFVGNDIIFTRDLTTALIVSTGYVAPNVRVYPRPNWAEMLAVMINNIRLESVGAILVAEVSHV